MVQNWFISSCVKETKFVDATKVSLDAILQSKWADGIWNCKVSDMYTLVDN